MGQFAYNVICLKKYHAQFTLNFKLRKLLVQTHQLYSNEDPLKINYALLHLL